MHWRKTDTVAAYGAQLASVFLTRLCIVLMLASTSAALEAAESVKERLEGALRAQKAGDLPGAAVVYRDLLAANPRLTVARHLLGVCELQSGNMSEGIRQLEQVRREDPANRQAAYTLVSTYVAVGMLDGARKILDSSLRGDVSAPGHFMRGSYAMATAEYSLAIRELEQARRLDSRLPGVTSQLGIAHCFANSLDKAVPLLEAALVENPGDTNAAAFLGWLYKDRDRTAEAEALLNRTVRARPDDKGAIFLLAQLAQLRGEKQQAVEMLEKVVLIDAAHRPAHVLLARLYAQMKRPEDAARQREIVERLNAELQSAQPKAK